MRVSRTGWKRGLSIGAEEPRQKQEFSIMAKKKRVQQQERNALQSIQVLHGLEVQRQAVVARCHAGRDIALLAATRTTP
jgi:hypothetical protein